MTSRQKMFLEVLANFYLRYSKPEKAITVLEFVHQFFPHDIAIGNSLSFAYLLAEDYESALHQSENTLQEEKEISAADRAVAYLIKSKALWSLGNEEEASEAFQTFQKEIPSSDS